MIGQVNKYMKKSEAKDSTEERRTFLRRLLLRNLLPPRFSRVGLVAAFSAQYPGVGHPHRSNPPPAALTVAAKQERKNCATRSAALGNEHLSRVRTA